MPLWKYIDLNEYRRPEEPTREALQERLKRFLQRLRKGEIISGPVSVQAELRSASVSLLDRVAAAPRWGAAERALESCLAKWKEQEQTDQTVKIIVGPPGTGTSHVVRRWAERNGFRLIQPPPYRDILAGSEEWLRQLDGEDSIALPNLERFYLRHQNGIEGMRKFLDRLCGAPRRCLVGCSSWAWSYLGMAVQFEALTPRPLSLASFDGARLERWFHILAASGGAGNLVFRFAHDGSYALPPVESTVPGDEEQQADVPGEDIKPDQPSSPFLQKLAARSRGNPLVAWAVWRQCLHIGKDEDVEEEAQEAAARDRGRTLWIRPWSEVQLPEIPRGTGTAELLLLHTLLLHDGLPADILDQLLPFSLGDIAQRLYRLRSEGLVKRENSLWRVTLLGYPAVRAALSEEDYLVDAF
jgi:hypothetical protein